MSDNNQLSDELLQYLFGELDATRQAAVRKAVAEDAELAAIAQRLASAIAAVRAENVGQVSGDFNNRLRRRLSEVIEPDQAETTCPVAVHGASVILSAAKNPLRNRGQGKTLRCDQKDSRSLATWRWIMHSPVSRVAAAAIFVLAVTGIAWWFHAGGTTPVYADFLKPILEAKTVRYKTTSKFIGAAGSKFTAVVMMLGPSRTRWEQIKEEPDKPKEKSVIILDGYQGKSLTLHPELKLATVWDDAGYKDKTPKDADPSSSLRSLFLEAQNPPNGKPEPLGEKNIDGRHVIGFRITAPCLVIDIWGDPKTGMPVRIEETRELMPNVKLKTTTSDFELNVDLDESLFSVEPPAGYKVTIGRQTNDGPPGEKSLIETFRTYLGYSGFVFPDSLDPRKMEASCDNEVGNALIWDMCTPLNGKLDEKKRRKIEELLHKSAVLQEKHDSQQKKPNKDEMAKREKQEHKLTEELYTLVDWDKVAPGKKNLSKKEKEICEEDYTEKFFKKCPRAGIIENQIWLHPGFQFANGLPPEADAHYAGKGVNCGAPDKPIFWYRPKDSKKYRVIYADLSVRDADTPPNVPNAQPVPGESSPKK